MHCACMSKVNQGNPTINDKRIYLSSTVAHGEKRTVVAIDLTGQALGIVLLHVQECKWEVW